jgi:elongator complex protein 3
LHQPLREIIDFLLSKKQPTKHDLDIAKFKITRDHKLGYIPSNSEIIKLLKDSEKKKLIPILRRKATRAKSGVNVVAVMTKPYTCPHGRCVFCPGGPENSSPQSYTGHEPAAMRGIQNEFDPFEQVRNRIEQLKAIGHAGDKIDLIVMGGTFPASPIDYQVLFMKGCLDAITMKPSMDLNEAKLNAEKSKVRNVGITFETRPDHLESYQIDRMLELGGTRIEIGVQNIYDDIYKIVGRGHTVKHVINGTKLVKNSGLKICYHMMPGLPGSNFDRDLEGFKTIFNNFSFKPDMLKIYPTLVVKGTRLYDWWINNEYDSFTTENGIKLLMKVKQMVPPWIRIMRIQRDIPLHQIEAGVTKGNLRQIVKQRLKEDGSRCNCIRCREVWHRERDGILVDKDSLDIIHRNYEASDGIEEFISVEDKNQTLIGFIRLRIPSEPLHRHEITPSTGLIRELHIYGEMTPMGEEADEWQHQGWGAILMNEAEKTAREKFNMNKMIVTSALGTKEYYKRLGYVKEGVYVSKILT